jgi:ketosteroid isomerase-like protein
MYHVVVWTNRSSRLDGRQTEEIMRTPKMAFLLVVVLSLIPAQTVVSQKQQPKLKDQLQELLTSMDRAMVDGNTEAVLAFYADDAVVLPNNAPKIVGKASIRKNMEDTRKTGVTFGSFAGTVEQAWECGDMVYCVASYALSANLPQVARPVGDKGKSLVIFRRTADGKLQIVYDMWNTDIEMGK